MTGLRARLLKQASSNLLTDADPAVVRDYYQGVIDSVNSVIYTVNRDLHIIGVNRQWDAFALANGGEHLSSEHILGCPLLGQMRGVPLERWRTICPQILGGQIPRYVDEIVCEEQNDWRHYTLAANSLKDRQGDILGITFVATNITQLKRAEAEMLKRLVEIRGLRHLAHAAGAWFNQRAFYKQVTADIAHLFDADKCVILQWGKDSGHLQAQAPAFGLTERELIGLSLDIDDPTGLKSLWQDLEKRDYVLLNEAVDASNSVTPFQANKLAAMMAMLRVSGRVYGAILVAGRNHLFSDQDGQLLTALAAQIVLVIEGVELNQRLNDRTRQLAKTRQELARMTEITTSLRLPLTVVRGYLELMLDGALGPVSEGQIATVDMLFNKMCNVTDLVNQFPLSQFLPDVTRYEPIQLADLVFKALDKQASSIEEAGLEPVVQLPLTGSTLTGEGYVAVGDPDSLFNVFDVLLDHAVKFSRSGGTIQVSLHESSEIIYVKIDASGADVSVHHLLQIWQPKEQTSHPDSIDLARVKQIVQDHSGCVWTESLPGQGIAFYVALPKMTLE